MLANAFMNKKNELSTEATKSRSTGAAVMGTALAPNYANLFTDRFETKAFNNYPMKPLMWQRFIDDIFLIWTHGEDSLKEFVNCLNSLNPTIKFTSETKTKSVNFLDTTVKLDQERNIINTLYNKPTDTHLFLHHTSAPDSVTYKGPYGQYLRLRRICSLDSDFEENAEKLTQYYLKRGYPIKQLKATIRESESSHTKNYYKQRPLKRPLIPL